MLCIINVTVKEKSKDDVGQHSSFTAIGGYGPKLGHFGYLGNLTCEWFTPETAQLFSIGLVPCPRHLKVYYLLLSILLSFDRSFLNHSQTFDPKFNRVCDVNPQLTIPYTINLDWTINTLQS